MNSVTSVSTRRRVFRSLGVLVGLFLMLAVGSPLSAQGFQLAGLDGSQLTRAQVERGDWVIVVWASWSPRARNIGAKIDALESRFGSRAEVCAVHFQDSAEDVRESFGGKLPSAPVYVDAAGDFSKHYQVTDLPALLVLRDGKVVHRGRLPSDPESLVAPLLGTR